MWHVLLIAFVVGLGVCVGVVLLAVLLTRLNHERHYLESAEAMRERAMIEETRKNASR